MTRFLRSGLALLLTVALLLGPASVALADKGGNGHGRGNSARFSSLFYDWQSGFWANESLARMIIKGVMKGGEEDNHLVVQANRPVTKLEAAIMLVRLLGLDQSGAPAVTNPEPIDPRLSWPPGLASKYKWHGGDDKEEVEFEDEGEVPAWGRDAIAIALAHDFLVFEGRRLNPMAPLKRVEAAIMLVKAAGLDDEAKARAGEALPFKDAAAISYTAKGYVAVALEKGFINGVPDGTFQPNKPVTRAQWAAMLDRFDRGQSTDQHQVKGTITAINLGGAGLPTISMTTPVFPGGVTYTVADQAVFFVGGKEATINDLQVGNQVLVQLSDTRQILMVTVVGRSQAGLTGSVVAFTAPTATQNGTIILQAGSGAGQAYAVASTALVWLGSLPGTFADVRVGDQVTLSMNNGVVTAIAINVSTQRVQGVVTARVAASGTTPGNLTLVTTGGATTTYAVAANATIVSAAGTNLTLNDISVGDTVELQVQRSVAVSVKVLQSASSQTVSGTLIALTIGSAATPSSLTLATGSGAASYTVAANATVTYNNQPLTLGDLRIGDTLTLTLENGAVVAIRVTQRQAQSTVLTGSLGNLNTLGRTFTLTVSGTVYTVGWNAQTAFTYQGLNVTSLQLANGQQVTVSGTADGTLVTASKVDIQVNQANVTGTIVSLTAPSGTTPGAISISAGGATSSYQVATNATVTWQGLPISIADLVVGDGVKLTLTNAVVSKIELASHQAASVNLTGKVSNLNTTAKTFTFTVQTTDASGQTVTQVFSAGYTDQTTFTYLGLTVSAASLANGQTVAVTGSQVGQAVAATRMDIQQIN